MKVREDKERKKRVHDQRKKQMKVNMIKREITRIHGERKEKEKDAKQTGKRENNIQRINDTIHGSPA